MDALDTHQSLALALQILAGVGLAAATGLRAFLPPLVVGVLARLDLLALRDSLDWLQSTPALVILGSAVVVELLGDKIPWVDHLLDGLGVVVKPAAGVLIVASVITDLPPAATGLIALVLGGTVAGTVHVTRAGLRAASTGATGGLANPVLSVAEDGLSLSTTLVAVFAPLLVLAGLILVAVILFRRRRRASSLSPPAAPATPHRPPLR